MKHYDAIIIGAGPAGTATAMELAMGGAKVLIAERAPQILDTLSTHALMRPAVTLLEQWGLYEKIAKGAMPVTRTNFFYGHEEKFAIPNKPGTTPFIAPRRYVLDQVLADAALEAGAELVFGANLVQLLRKPDGQVSGVELTMRNGVSHRIRADLVIGADGRNSTVAALVGAQTLVTSDKFSATAYCYVKGVKNDGYRWYFGRDAALGLIPTHDGAHCLFASCQPGQFKARFGGDAMSGILKTLAMWEPELASELTSRSDHERPRRFAGAPGHIKAASGKGWALVGDAGYFKDPATAHGITDALLDARRLARAVLTNSLSSYGWQRDEGALPMFRLTHEIASMEHDFDQLKELHAALSQCMKREQAELIEDAQPLAA